MPRLKVFCASSGFHASIVAAPSRPAALKAWGARTDLFSMGVARQVTDPKIVEILKGRTADAAAALGVSEMTVKRYAAKAGIS